MKVLNKQRIHLAALSTGPAIRMLKRTVEHAKTRVQFCRPIADFQFVQAMIVAKADHSTIERWYRDIRLFRLYEGTSQIHQLNIARQVLAAAS